MDPITLAYTSHFVRGDFAHLLPMCELVAAGSIFKKSADRIFTENSVEGIVNMSRLVTCVLQSASHGYSDKLNRMIQPSLN